MDRAHQNALAARILEHRGAGTQDLADAEMFQGIEVYRDTAQGVAEREQLIKRWPIAVAHASELPEPGDFITDTITGTPLLVIRQGDGSVRAFVNLCRHRATKVEWEASGNRRLFTCPYHAWSYERDGALRNIPVQDVGFPCVDKADHGLIELPCEQRHGIVWTILTPGAALDVAAYLGPELDAELAGWNLDAAVQERIDRFDNPFNWKLTIDGFLEGYHLRFLHAKTIGPYTVPDLCLHDEWGPHTRMTIVRKSFEAQEHLPAEQLDLPTCTIPVYILFPATILVWQNDHWELWTSFPDARDTTRSIARARLMAPDANSVDAQRALWDKNWRILMDTVEQEDWKAMEYLQEGLDAAPEHVVFGRNEPTLQYFHRTIERYTGEAAATR
ncbi:MAG: aromatic ring-hydroxylating dioxygenase subunit alpha [Acidimicrobiia bacterium]